VLTIVFTYFGSSFQSDADPESFNPDHELIMASEDAGDTFGTEEYNILVIVKTSDSNVLQMDDMKTLIEFEDTLRSDEIIDSAIVPSPNNPTGTALKVGEIERIAGNFDGIVAVDEAYYEFYKETAQELIDELNNIVILRTFSKALRLAGIRLGYLLGRVGIEAHLLTISLHRQGFSLHLLPMPSHLLCVNPEPSPPRPVKNRPEGLIHSVQPGVYLGGEVLPQGVGSHCVIQTFLCHYLGGQIQHCLAPP